MLILNFQRIRVNLLLVVARDMTTELEYMPNFVPLWVGRSSHCKEFFMKFRYGYIFIYKRGWKGSFLAQTRHPENPDRPIAPAIAPIHPISPVRLVGRSGLARATLPRRARPCGTRHEPFAKPP